MNVSNIAYIYIITYLKVYSGIYIQIYLLHLIGAIESGSLNIISFTQKRYGLNYFNPYPCVCYYNFENKLDNLTQESEKLISSPSSNAAAKSNIKLKGTEGTSIT